MNKLIGLCFFALTLIPSTIKAQKKEVDKIQLYGDVRFRAELDRDSKKADGTYRADRDRLRIRLRLGIKYELTDFLEIGGRIRSGNPSNPQSSNVTLGNGFTNKDISIDKAYFKYQKRDFYLWVGKNSINMWEPDEMLWDSDVMPEGIGLGKIFNTSKNSTLNLNTGYFIVFNTVEDNSQTFENNTHVTFLQLKYTLDLNSYKLILSPGIISSNTEKVLENDYNIFTAFVQLETKSGLNFNIDYFNNMADLEGKVDLNFENQTSGLSTTLGYNFTKQFSAKISYASIEKYAVIDRFAQDDWVRWDAVDDFGITYTRSSNFSGFGVVLKYNIMKNFDTQLKFWNVEGLVKATDDTTLETGTRIRLDFNIKF